MTIWRMSCALVVMPVYQALSQQQQQQVCTMGHNTPTYVGTTRLVTKPSFVLCTGIVPSALHLHV